jgi:hypothetical protein
MPTTTEDDLARLAGNAWDNGIQPDAIDIRVKSWANIYPDPRVGPDFLWWSCGPLQWISAMDGTMIARVDGGDPGDENDGQ